MTSTNPALAATDPAPAATKRRNAFSLAWRGAALTALVIATTVGIVIGIPETNDYARISINKHAALATPAERKIVLIGGSNLSFGVDSTLISEATGCPVVNMGINGYFGVKYMLNEVRPSLNPQDIAVIAWEYDSFVKSVEGAPTDLLVLTKANPETFRYLDSDQLREVVLTYPYAAQQKVLRLMEEARYLATVLVNPEAAYTPGEVDIIAIESVASFNAAGDIVAHVNVAWPEDIHDGMDLTALPRDPNVIPLMEAFTRDMEARGVAVMTSFSPALDRFYAQHKTVIDAISDDMQASPVLHTPSPASKYVFEPDEHFDTVYHLNGKGRERRSRMLVADLLETFGDRALCRPEQN